MKSPFQYGTLVDKESFVNRVEERKQLKELLGSGINVMLISPRRWGKSSLVKVAMDELTQEDKHIRVCFIDAFSIKTEAEFYRIFAREVISCTASTLEKRLEDVKQFLKAVSPSITLKSDPTDTLSFDLKLELEEKSVMEILELPEKIAAFLLLSSASKAPRTEVPVSPETAPGSLPKNLLIFPVLFSFLLKMPSVPDLPEVLCG